MSCSGSKLRAIQKVDQAIRELRRVRQSIRKGNFERAENEVGETLEIIGRLIKKINRAEAKSNM